MDGDEKPQTKLPDRPSQGASQYSSSWRSARPKMAALSRSVCVEKRRGQSQRAVPVGTPCQAQVYLVLCHVSVIPGEDARKDQRSSAATQRGVVPVQRGVDAGALSRPYRVPVVVDAAPAVAQIAQDCAALGQDPVAFLQRGHLRGREARSGRDQCAK